MSLLEDVFLEDEAGEAQELERIIEGDEYNERPPARSDSDDNSEREDEAEEEKRRVDPSSTKSRTRVIKNPRFILNPARLTGPRGIQVIPEHFKDFKFRGKGHEKNDLDLVLKKLEHWAYRLYPKFRFEDCLKKIETLGKKRPVMVHLHKIRSDQYMSEETVVQRDSSDDEAPPETPPEDEFDKLLQQQIDLARSTPAPQASKGMDSAVKENKSFIMPKATSSPSISVEQRERILRSKKLAEERRLAKLKNMKSTHNSNITYTPSKHDGGTYTLEKINENENEANTLNDDNEHALSQNEIIEITSFQKENTLAKVSRVNEINKINIVDTENVLSIEENDLGNAKRVRANVIDSSDEEDNVVVMNESIRVDVHTNLDEKADDRDGHTIIKQGSRNNGHNIDDDDDVIEIDDKSKDGQENNDSHYDRETGISTNNQNEKCDSNQESDILDQEVDVSKDEDTDYTNEKQGSTHADGRENNLSEKHFGKVFKIDDSNKSCHNLDNINKEIDTETILSEINSNHASPKNDKAVEVDKKSPKANSLQEFGVIKDSLKGEQRRDSNNVPEQAVVIDELMDVDFDDDF